MSPDYKCEIFIQLKPEAFDVGGATIKNCLEQLGFEGIGRFRMGREIIFMLEAKNIREARKEVDKIATAPVHKMVNPKMETYTATVTYQRPKRHE